MLDHCTQGRTHSPRPRRLLHRRPAPRRRFERPQAPQLARQGSPPEEPSPRPAIPARVSRLADVTARANLWAVTTAQTFVPIAASPGLDRTVPSPVQTAPIPLQNWSTAGTAVRIPAAPAAGFPPWLTIVAFVVGAVVGATLM